MIIPIARSRTGVCTRSSPGGSAGDPLNIKKQVAALHRAAARKANELEAQRAVTAQKLASLDRELRSGSRPRPQPRAFAL